MRLQEYLDFAKQSLLHRKLRSWLTILGIIIGIASVFSLLSIGAGFEQSIKEELSSLGGNFIFITPSAQQQEGPSFGFSGVGGPGQGASEGELTKNDINAVRGVRGVEFTDGFVFDNADIEFRGEVVQTAVQGFTVDIVREFPLIELAEGRIFSSAETKVAIIGHTVAKDFFDREINLGDIILVDGENFRVIGIWEEGSGATASIFDSAVSVNRRDAERLFLDPGSNEIDAILVKVSETADIDQVTENVEKRMRASHKVVEGEEDFTATSSKAIQSSVEEITGGINLFLGAIAAISLLVGAIGIVNTMFMSVMERTKQIGILKAIGATNRQIMSIFLIESSMLGLMGGIIGVLIGLSFGLIISNVESLGGTFRAVITAELIVFSLGFAVLVGAVAGLLPARRAAKLDPVVALRYE